MNIDQNEIWKPVNGFEGRYEISNFGRLKSLPKWNKNRLSGYLRKEAFLKPKKGAKGYMHYELSDGNGLSKTFKRSRLVAMHFIPNPENKEQVNHKDGIRSNDHYQNLEWNTQAENIQHSYDKLGRKAAYKDKFGKDHNQSKPVIIFNNVGSKEFENITRASEYLGVSIQAVSMAVRKVNKSCKGYKCEYK
jgi:hypothetical protein